MGSTALFLIDDTLLCFLYYLHLDRLNPAGDISVQRCPRDLVTVGVLGQSIGVGAICLPLKHQTESVRYHNVARSSRVRYHLPVIETELFCVPRMHDGRACPFPFVPGRIPQRCVGVVIHVPAGRHDEGVRFLILFEFF